MDGDVHRPALPRRRQDPHSGRATRFRRRSGGAAGAEDGLLRAVLPGVGVGVVEAEFGGVAAEEFEDEFESDGGGRRRFRFAAARRLRSADFQDVVVVDVPQNFCGVADAEDRFASRRSDADLPHSVNVADHRPVVLASHTTGAVMARKWYDHRLIQNYISSTTRQSSLRPR